MPSSSSHGSSLYHLSHTPTDRSQYDRSFLYIRSDTFEHGICNSGQRWDPRTVYQVLQKLPKTQLSKDQWIRVARSLKNDEISTKVSAKGSGGITGSGIMASSSSEPSTFPKGVGVTISEDVATSYWEILKTLLQEANIGISKIHTNASTYASAADLMVQSNDKIDRRSLSLFLLLQGYAQTKSGVPNQIYNQEGIRGEGNFAGEGAVLASPRMSSPRGINPSPRQNVQQMQGNRSVDMKNWCFRHMDEILIHIVNPEIKPPSAHYNHYLKEAEQEGLQVIGTGLGVGHGVSLDSRTDSYSARYNPDTGSARYGDSGSARYNNAYPDSARSNNSGAASQILKPGPDGIKYIVESDLDLLTIFFQLVSEEEDAILLDDKMLIQKFQDKFDNLELKDSPPVVLVPPVQPPLSAFIREQIRYMYRDRVLEMPLAIHKQPTVTGDENLFRLSDVKKILIQFLKFPELTPGTNRTRDKTMIAYHSAGSSNLGNLTQSLTTQSLTQSLGSSGQLQQGGLGSSGQLLQGGNTTNLVGLNNNSCWEEAVLSKSGGEQSFSSTLTLLGLSKCTHLERGGRYKRAYIMSCKDCTIYLTESVEFVLLKSCENCQVILIGDDGGGGRILIGDDGGGDRISLRKSVVQYPPTTTWGKMVTIHDCRNCEVHIYKYRLLKIDNSIDVTCYAGTYSQPILCGDSRGIKMGPCNLLVGNSNGNSNSNTTNDHMIGNDNNSSMSKVNRLLATKWSEPLFCHPREQEFRLINPKDIMPMVIPGISPITGFSTLITNRTVQKKRTSLLPDHDDPNNDSNNDPVTPNNNTGVVSAMNDSPGPKGFGMSQQVNKEQINNEQVNKAVVFEKGEEIQHLLLLPEVYCNELLRKKEAISQFTKESLPYPAKLRIQHQFQAWLEGNKSKQLKDLGRITQIRYQLNQQLGG